MNACVDFRLLRLARASLVVRPPRQRVPHAPRPRSFERDTSGQKFWDPPAPSCTGFIARTLAARDGWRADDLAELVRWADVSTRRASTRPPPAVRLEAPPCGS